MWSRTPSAVNAGFVPAGYEADEEALIGSPEPDRHSLTDATVGPYWHPRYGSAVRIEPFEIAVDDHILLDLRNRLGGVRLPNTVSGIGWDQGTDRSYLVEVLDHWRNSYDWRAQEAELNRWPQVLTEVDGQRIHAVHARSPHPGALPLLLCHGWPGSVVEFLDVFGPLTDPPDPADAFHVSLPRCPGTAGLVPPMTKGGTLVA